MIMNDILLGKILNVEDITLSEWICNEGYNCKMYSEEHFSFSFQHVFVIYH